MNNKLLIALSLMAMPAIAMEHMELTKEQQSVIPSDTTEEKVVITIEGQERELPKRYIPLIGTLEKLYAEGTPLQMSPITLVSLETWQFIEDQLERVYEISQGNTGARDEIIKEIRSRKWIERYSEGREHCTRLLDLIRVADYLGIAILRDIALDVADGELHPIENVFELPEMLRNEVIKRRFLDICGLEVMYSDAYHYKNRAPKSWVSIAILDDDDASSFINVNGSLDGTLCIWDNDNYTPTQWQAHKGEVSSVCANRGIIDSGIVGLIASCSKHETTVRIWGIEGGLLADCMGHEKGVTSVCVTRDGSKIASGSEDRTVRIWDRNGQKLAVCKGHEGPVTTVCVTKDNKIVSGSEDRTVRIWDMDGNQLAVFKGHEGPVRSVCVTDDNRIVSGSEDRTVRIWDMDGNQLAVFKGHEGPVRSVCVTKDNKKIVTCSGFETMRIGDMNGTELEAFKLKASFIGSRNILSVCALIDSYILCGRDDGIVGMLDTSLLDSLSVMSEGQAKFIYMMLDYTKNVLDVLAYVDVEKMDNAYWVISKCIETIEDYFSKEIFFEPKKRKELEDVENSAAKKVRLEEELDNEKKEQNHE